MILDEVDDQLRVTIYSWILYSQFLDDSEPRNQSFILSLIISCKELKMQAMLNDDSFRTDNDYPSPQLFEVGWPIYIYFPSIILAWKGVQHKLWQFHNCSLGRIILDGVFDQEISQYLGFDWLLRLKFNIKL